MVLRRDIAIRDSIHPRMAHHRMVIRDRIRFRVGVAIDDNNDS